MATNDYSDNDGFVGDAAWVRKLNKRAELAELVAEMAGDGDSRTIAYFQILKLMNDFQKSYNGQKTSPNEILGDMIKSLKAGRIRYPIESFLAWLCIFHHDKASQFYLDSGLAEEIGRGNRIYVGNPGDRAKSRAEAKNRSSASGALAGSGARLMQIKNDANDNLSSENVPEGSVKDIRIYASDVDRIAVDLLIGELGPLGISSKFNSISGNSFSDLMDIISKSNLSHDMVVLIANQEIFALMYNAISGKEYSDFKDYHIFSEKIIPIWFDVSINNARKIERALGWEASLFFESGSRYCAQWISRVVVSARLGDADLRSTMKTIHERNSGRGFLQDGLQEKIREKRKGRDALVSIVDIDKTNQINSRFGYEVGSKVIEQSLKIFKNNFQNRTHDIGRCGDDTFFIVTYEEKNWPAKSIKNFSDGLCKMISNYNWSLMAYNLSVTCSVGLAVKSDHEDAFDTVARAALAMNEAQAKGRNRAKFATQYLPQFGDIKSKRFWKLWS
ncbi:MAG TPA: diguanylate cyclase [Sphingobium sp.]